MAGLGQRHFAEALRLCPQSRLCRAEAILHASLAWVDQRSGDADRAHSGLCEALSIGREVWHFKLEDQVLTQLAEWHLARGEMGEAGARLDEADELLTGTDATREWGQLYVQQGGLAAAAGRPRRRRTATARVPLLPFLQVGSFDLSPIAVFLGLGFLDAFIPSTLAMAGMALL